MSKASTNESYLALPKVSISTNCINHVHFLINWYKSSKSNEYNFEFCYINGQPFFTLKSVLVSQHVTAAALIRKGILSDLDVLRVRMKSVNVKTLVSAEALNSVKFKEWFYKTASSRNKEEIIPKFLSKVYSADCKMQAKQNCAWHVFPESVLVDNSKRYYEYIGRTKQNTDSTKNKLQELISQINALGFSCTVAPSKK